MLRLSLGSLAVVLICSGGLLADEIKGKIKSIDTEKNTVTVTIEKELTLPLTKDLKVVQPVGKAGKNGKVKKTQLQDVPGGLAGLAPGAEVTLTTDKSDGKEVITQVQAAGSMPKKTKKKNK